MKAAVRLHQRIVAGQVGQGPAPSEGGDRAVYETRVDPGGAGEVEPELADRAGAEALDEDVRARDQALEDLGSPVGFQIEGEAPLVAVHRHERGALVAPVRRRPRPGVVAATRALHLDDLGPHVAEDLCAEGPRDVLRQVCHDDPFQRPRHGEESSRKETGHSATKLAAASRQWRAGTTG